jgi:hypothetical protein
MGDVGQLYLPPAEAACAHGKRMTAHPILRRPRMRPWKKDDRSPHFGRMRPFYGVARKRHADVEEDPDQHQV